MNPLKGKAFIKQTAIETKLEERVVEDCILFYYKELRATLSNLKHPKVKVDGIGYFKVKHWLLDGEIEKLKILENKTKTEDKKQSLIQDILSLENIKEMVVEEKQKKKEKKEKRKQYESKKNME